MTPNHENHCHMHQDSCFDMENAANKELDLELEDGSDEDDWRRFSRYIAAIVGFFYILFKFLI